MIYTITFNPAVDLVIKVPQVHLGDLNRSVGEDYVAGGKGINMSVILKRLGLDNTAVAFLGGFSGHYIQESLEKEAISVKAIPVDGITRVNVKLKSQEETEINAAGAFVSREKFQELLDFFQDRLQADDVVFLAGNKAPGMDEADYVAIAELVQAKGARLVLDTTKQLLTQCLPYHPFLIKPNHHELGEIFGVDITSEDQIVTYAKKLQDMGARNVLISRGGDGSMLVSETGDIYTANVPKGKLVNSVGAGDSMLSGFMASYLDQGRFDLALQQGAATGSATAFSVGIASLELINELKGQIVVTKVN